MKMKWDSTSDKSIFSLVTPSDNVVSATIIDLEKSGFNVTVRNNPWYLHMTLRYEHMYTKEVTYREVTEYFRSEQSAKKFVRDFWK